MSPKQINVALRNLFNGNGIDANGFKIKADSPLTANITHENDTTVINFSEKTPRVEIKKLITLRAYIEQVIFAEEGGSVKLRNFPDIHFKYDDKSLMDLIHANFCHSFEIEHEIKAKYTDCKQKEIANQCLQYAQEWATICSSSGINFEEVSVWKRRDLKRGCYNFVRDNIAQEIDDQKKHGAVFTFMFLYVILPAIISWIVHRVLDRLFTK